MLLWCKVKDRRHFCCFCLWCVVCYKTKMLLEDVKKMKVTELREALKTRGLDTKGNKPVLVKRLENFLKKSIAGENGTHKLML